MNPNRRWLVVLAAAVIVLAQAFSGLMKDFLEVAGVGIVCFSMWLQIKASRDMEHEDGTQKKKGMIRRAFKIVAYAFLPALLSKSDMVAAGKEVGGDMQSTAGHLKALKEVALKKKKREYRKETFADAIARHRLTEKDLVLREKAWARQAMLLMIITDIFLCFVLAGVVVSEWFMVINALSGSVIFYTASLVTHFRLDQIRRRELYAFQTYFFDHGGWWKATFIH